MTAKELFSFACDWMGCAEKQQARTSFTPDEYRNAALDFATVYAKLAETAFLLESEPETITLSGYPASVKNADWDSPTTATPIAELRELHEKSKQYGTVIGAGQYSPAEDESGTVATVGDGWHKWPDGGFIISETIVICFTVGGIVHVHTAKQVGPVNWEIEPDNPQPGYLRESDYTIITHWIHLPPTEGKP